MAKAKKDYPKPRSKKSTKKNLKRFKKNYQLLQDFYKELGK